MLDRPRTWRPSSGRVVKSGRAARWGKRLFKPGAPLFSDAVKLSIVLALILGGVGILAYEWRHAQRISLHAGPAPALELR